MAQLSPSLYISFFLGDAAQAFTKAVSETWGHGVTRLMCWAHTSRAIDRSKYVAVLNEDSFMAVFRLLESKHTVPNFPELDDAVKNFFQYLRTVWVESEERRWYEGAHPFAPGHNQSVEGINRSIKANQTFRLKLPMGELFVVTLRMVKEMSQVGKSERPITIYIKRCVFIL